MGSVPRTYPSIWAQYSYFAFSDCSVGISTSIRSAFTATSTDWADVPSWTSTEIFPETTYSYTIQSGKHLIMPATADPARFFYRAEGWDYDNRNPSTVTAPMLDYLESLETVREQMEGHDVRTCIFATCAPTAVGHSMVSATVLVESTEVASAVYYNAPTSDQIPALPISTPDTTSPTTPPPAPPPAQTPDNEPPAEQQPPSPVPDSPEAPAPAPTRSSVEVIIVTTGGSDGETVTITTALAGGDAAVPDTTFVRTTTIDGQAQEQTVVSPAPLATPPPGEVTLIREVTSNGQTLTETFVSVSAAPTAQASEETIVTTVTGADGAQSTLTLISIAPGTGPQPSEVTFVTTATLNGTPVVQTIVSVSAANQGGSDSEGGITGAPGAQALATTTRTIVSDGQTYIQTLISPVETGSSPGDTTFVRTATSGGSTLVQTVVSQLPSGGAGGNEDQAGSTPSATGGSAGSESSGPVVVNGGVGLDPSAGKGLAIMAAVMAVGLILDL